MLIVGIDIAVAFYKIVLGYSLQTLPVRLLGHSDCPVYLGQNLDYSRHWLAQDKVGRLVPMQELFPEWQLRSC
jgi:hypothetical protein